MAKSRLKYLCVYVKSIVVGNLKKSMNAGLFVIFASLVILSLIGILSVLSNGPASSPTATIFNAPTHQIFVTNWASDSVSVINASNYSTVKTITGFKKPLSIAPLQGKGEIFVANSGSNTISVISTTTDTISFNITVGQNPVSMAFTPDSKLAYVTNSNNTGNISTISVINTTTYNVVNTIRLQGGSAGGIAISPDGLQAFVAIVGSKYIAIINTSNSGVNYLYLGEKAHTPCDAYASPNSAYIFIGSCNANGVYIINTITDTLIGNITNIGGGSDPYGSEITVSPDGSKLLISNVSSISNSPSGTVSVIDTSNYSIYKIINNIGSPYALEFSPNGSRIFITDYETASLYVLNATTYSDIKRIHVGLLPSGVAMT